MPTSEEIRKVTDWCEGRKKERNSVYIVERNPFASKFDWARHIISIEIDRPLSIAAKTSMVYDSTAKKLYRYVNGTWAPFSGPKDRPAVK